jgi:hypothetical protein
MSTDNEREIRDRLGGALDTITPTRPPVGAVLRQGRTIRLRRRAAVAAGLAAVVGLGVALPGLVAHVRATPPVQPSYRVTVNPTRDTPGKLVFSGTINGKPWRFEADWNRGDVTQSAPGASEYDMSNIRLDGQPAWLDEVGVGRGANAELLVMGEVGRDVSRLVFNEPGGRSIDVTPVRWHGERWAGVAIPARQHLRSVVLHSGRGEVAYAIPFDNTNTINVWLKPGQHGLRRQRATIATGVVSGKRWSLEGYAGPWGVCFSTSDENNADCFQAYGSRLRPGHLISWMSCGPFGAPGSQFWNAQSASDVSYLEFRLSDGSRQRVVPVPLAGYHYFALAFGAHQHLSNWTAYGASGQVLGSGSVSPKC